MQDSNRNVLIQHRSHFYKIQNQIVEKLEEERKIIQGNKKLIEIYTQKIGDRINKIWGE